MPEAAPGQKAARHEAVAAEAAQPQACRPWLDLKAGGHLSRGRRSPLVDEAERRALPGRGHQPQAQRRWHQIAHSALQSIGALSRLAALRPRAERKESGTDSGRLPIRQCSLGPAGPAWLQVACGTAAAPAPPRRRLTYAEAAGLTLGPVLHLEDRDGDGPVAYAGKMLAAESADLTPDRVSASARVLVGFAVG